jgi:integrase
MQLELAIYTEGTLYEAITWTIKHRVCADATKAQHHDHRRWLLEWFGDCHVSKVTFPRVLEYIESEKTRGIMVATVKKRLGTLRMALEDCYRRGLLPRTVDWWPDIVSDSKPGQDLWTYDQWRQGRLAFEPEQRIGIDVLFWTGMHTSDVKRWRRSDVNLIKGEWRRYNTKSKSDLAWLPLPAEFAGILEDWFVTGGIVADAQRVAPDWWVSPIKPMARVCLRAGLPRITQLGLRRSCVSYQFELGAAKNMDMKRLAEWVAHWLGHKGDPMTSDIIRRHYMRWTPKAIALSSPFA